ncbi:MAG: metallophosphoesterase family protein [Planctomycetota bacterium]
MTIAIISDIHSNLAALEAVMKDLREQDARTVYCIGDVIGYGPDPIPCVDIVMAVCTMSTMGNHDFGLVKMPFGFNKYAREAIEWTRTRMKPGLLDFAARRRWKWIENLPQTHKEGRIHYLHASPLDPIMDYVKESDVEDMGLGVSDKMKLIFDKVEHLCFIGHTHRPAVFTDDYHCLRPDQLVDDRMELDPGRKYLINIGSVGQPRDLDPRACYVLFDGERNIRFRRVAYDVDQTVQRIHAIPALDPRLGDRLRDGR